MMQASVAAHLKTKTISRTAPPVYRPGNAQHAAQRSSSPTALHGAQRQKQNRAGLRPPGSKAFVQRVVQPKLGFELEVPVTFLTKDLENVAGKQTYLNGPHFKVVGDGSPQAGQMRGVVNEEEVLYSPTILEIVTHPIDEHADDALSKMSDVLASIETFRFRLYLQTNGFTKTTTLGKLADSELKLELADTSDFIINHPTDTPRNASPESAYIHLTVGVSVGALRRAGDWIKNRALHNYPGNATHKDANDLINSTELFKHTIDNLTTSSFNVSDQIDDFLYLAYSHVRAIDRYESEDTRVEGGGTKKNYTPFLSRAPFHQVFKSLHKDAQKYLVDHKVKLKEILAGKLHKDGATVEKAQTYLTAIFDQTVVSQEAFFGGMVERGVERTGKEGSGLVGPPVEIRPLGTALSEKQVREVVAQVFDASRNQFKNTKAKIPLETMTELALA
jgi:hypothetical protein